MNNDSLFCNFCFKASCNLGHTNYTELFNTICFITLCLSFIFITFWMYETDTSATESMQSWFYLICKQESRLIKF